ncbi:hypothetical protein pipiens_014065 [Culex pipiens pipiens]|uniref:Virilizer N-terminal domain-containing protein n=3 Tax=Culex pipiens TaxID=7175 RepID=A0ABD1CVZ3_CULPP
MDEETPELLFFDTFSHDTYEKLNLDLVQFPKPVYITEVRIIPLGARVQADFPGGVRLGATNPSLFKIELFVNDLGKPGAPTFECLGDFEYNQNNCIHLECGKPDDGARRIPTDGLVLKGFYTTITLAVYGILTANIAEPIVSPRETTPQPEVAPVEVVPAVDGPIAEPGGVGQEWPEEPPAVVVATEVFVQKEYPEPADGGEDIPKDPRPYARRALQATTVVCPAEPSSPKHGVVECEGAGGKKRVSRSTERHYEPRGARGRSHEYSRSPSLCKDYQGGAAPPVGGQKREWSRSPHRGSSSRRIRSSSYDRGGVRRGSTDDRGARDDRSGRRPRSPLDSPRRPRSPDPHDDYDEDDFRRGGHGKYGDKRGEGLPPRIKTTSVSAATPPGVEEEGLAPPTELFEAILSDEEIVEDFDYDVEYEMGGGGAAGGEDYGKGFNPFGAVLKKFELGVEKGGDETNSVRQLEIVLKNNRYNKKTTLEFGAESGDFKEGFVDYTEQIVLLLNQIFSETPQRVKFERTLEDWIAGKSEGVEIMLNCIKLGLDVDRAMTHPQPAYKLRHMKAGIRLIELLGATDAFIKVVLEQEDFNIFDKLLGLYSQSYMALSIKLMIIRSICACLDTKRGLDYFLSPEYNGYQILLDLIQENPSTRISFALKSLLKKINLYENLDLVRSTVSDVYATRNDPAFKPDPAQLSVLENCFAELTKAITWDAIAYSQPKRFLPVSSKFEIHKDIRSSVTANRSFVAFFNIHHLLETIIFLLELKLPSSSLIGAVYDLLSALLKNHQKLDYLMENVDAVNVLLKILFQHCPSPAADEDFLHDLTRGQLLGLEMAYKLQTLYYIDAIGQTREDVDRQVESLQALFQLACSFGKRYVVEVICMEQNMKLFLELIDGEKRALAKEGSPGMKHKSPVLSYSVDLVDCAVRHCEHVGYLVQHGEKLLNLVKTHEQFESSVSAMLQEMAVYLKPLEIHELFTYEDINPLVELMKRSLEFITTFPGDLIMSLRLLRFLGIPEHDGIVGANPSHVELKYKYTILQFYSADGKTLLISILEKLNTYFDQPALHASSLASMQGVLLTQILTPLVQILRKIMTYLIECRNTEFKDLTVIEPLLRTYALMQSVPVNAAAINDAREVQKDIIKILLTFTQPTPTDGLDTNNIHKSLWTQMVGELIKFILYGPNYFIPGLLVFSELLPLPLPIQCRQELTPTEISKLINERQLWSAHLHPQSPAITEMIQTICPSSYTPLLVIFSRVCLQLSDLAPNMTLLISKAITDLTIQEPLLPNTPTDDQKPLKGLATTAHARLFSFLGSLVCHASVKISVLSILSGRIMDLMTNILLNPGQTPAHQQTQENIYIVFQNLLDSEFSMVFANISPMMQLACSLPPKEIIESCCGTIVENIASEEVGMGVLVAAVRTMLLLTEHDITLSILLTAVEKRKDAMLAIVQKFADKAREAPDTYRQLFILLTEFWRSLITIDETALVGFNLPKRTIRLTPEQLGAMLVPKVIKKEGQELPPSEPGDCGQLLKELLVFFKPEPKPDAEPEEAAQVVPPVVDNLEDNLLMLLDQLKEAKSTGGECLFDFGVVEPLPQAEGIVTQYASRSVFIVSEEFEDQLKASYWLSFSPCDEDLEREQIPCDLQELAKSCLTGDCNLTSDCKRLLHLSASPHSTRDRVATAPCFRTRRVEVEPSTGRPEKKIFATPLRGRGFTRAPITRGDLFRSRPPNTSRPPSLHVDDFLALETCGAQPTGPTGYNKLSRDIITIRGSGRGRGRSFSDRGRSGGSGSGGGGGGGGGGWNRDRDVRHGPSGDHFGGGGGGGGGGGHNHYRESSQNHFGAPHVRSRSGRGFNRYGGRPYSRPI